MPVKRSMAERTAELWDEFAKTAGKGLIVDKEAYLKAGLAYVRKRLEEEGYPVEDYDEWRRAKNEKFAAQEKTDPFFFKTVKKALEKKRKGPFDVS